MTRTQPQIPSARHEAVIPPLERKGFAKSLRSHTGISLGTECRIIPDAFHFDHVRKVLTLYEAEVTHFISEDSGKLAKLNLLRDFMPVSGWRLRVKVAAIDGIYRPMDWATGRPKIARAELRRVVRLLDRAPL